MKRIYFSILKYNKSFSSSFSGTIVISSEGIGAEKQGNLLGQFQYNRLSKQYEQMNTEKDHEWYKPTFLFQTASKEWLINDIAGEEKGWLQNKKKTGGPQDLPLSGWLVYDYNDGKWKADPKIKITSGPLIPSCLKIKIDGTGPAAEIQSIRFGEYKLAYEEWFFGHPVYKQEDGNLLYMMNDGSWGVSDDFESYGIRGLPGYLCPSKSTKWEYYDGSEDKMKLGAINVTCSEYQ